jgi:hypothetical protein
MKILTNSAWPDRTAAFSRADLVALLAGALLFAIIAVPGLASGRWGSDVKVCANNLRQIAHAFSVWSTENGDSYPWQVAEASGGTLQKSSVWFHFSAISNEVASPQIFACPADLDRMPATHYSDSPNGLAHVRNFSISYFVALDPEPVTRPSVLLGDRHFSGGTPYESCRFLNVNVAYAMSRASAEAGSLRWTNALHGDNAGNLVLIDGRVETATSETLRRMMRENTPPAFPRNHVLPPR